MSTATIPGSDRATGTPAPTRATTAIPFGRLLRVEWGKATDTRASRWLLALVAVSTVGLVLRPLLAAGSEQSLSSYVRFAGTGLGILLPVVAILTLTSEWSQRTVLVTFTQEPRRARVVLAKLAVSVLLGAAGALFGLLVAVAALAVSGASGRAVDVDTSAGLLGGFVLFVLLNVLSGVAIGALLQHSAAAVVAYFVLPTGVAVLGTGVAFVKEWIDATSAFDWLLRGEPSGHWPQIAVAALLWVVAPLAAGLARTVRREIA
jgi:ABC-type transport system involved in multi-copper enzyme maturation permease subunit